MILQGWVAAMQRQDGEGIALMYRGLMLSQDTGTELHRPYWLALTAEAYGRHGQQGEGLKVITEALSFVERTEERWYEAELYRLRGELTLAQESQKAKVKGQKSKIETDPRSLTPDPHGEAEAYFLKAIAIARQQQAKSWELRGSTSLARLWQSQGKRAQAHKLLSEVYHWFTEGFATKDLQEARALLDSLESGS
jgi:predicted ATPase